MTMEPCWRARSRNKVVCKRFDRNSAAVSKIAYHFPLTALLFWFLAHTLLLIMDSRKETPAIDPDGRSSPSPSEASERQPLVKENPGDLFDVPPGSALIRKSTPFILIRDAN